MLRKLKIKKNPNNINTEKFIYVFKNSNGYFERTIDKEFISLRKDIIKINIQHENVWNVFKKIQYQDTPKYEIYERGSYDDYFGHYVRVNNFVLDYEPDFEYKFVKVNQSKKDK